MSEITQAASIQTATCETMFSRTIVRDQRRSTIWWSQTGSNRRPHACKARALPAELWPRNQKTNAVRRDRQGDVFILSNSLAFAHRATAEQPSPRRLAWPKRCARRLVGLGRLELPTS